MKWKLVLALGAAVGGLAYSHRRNRKARADAALWREATDPVERFGG